MKTEELDPSRSMLQQLRESHPMNPGQIVDGKKVRSTYYRMEGNEHVPYFEIEGEREARRCNENEKGQSQIAALVDGTHNRKHFMVAALKWHNDGNRATTD